MTKTVTATTGDKPLKVNNSAIAFFSTENEKYENRWDQSFDQDVSKEVVQAVDNRVNALNEPHLLTRVEAFEQYSEMMHFFKTNSAYSNTNAAALYEAKWKKHTGLNPVSDWFLLQIQRHATKLLTVGSIASCFVSLAAFAMLTLPLAPPLGLFLLGVAITTAIASIIGLKLLTIDHDYPFLKSTEERANQATCIN